MEEANLSCSKALQDMQDNLQSSFQGEHVKNHCQEIKALSQHCYLESEIYLPAGFGHRLKSSVRLVSVGTCQCWDLTV